MNAIEKLAFIFRCNLIIDNLKNCQSGSEIHQVGNMRQTAQSVLELIETDVVFCSDKIEGIIGRLEQQELCFFKKKFEYLDASQTQTLSIPKDDTNTSATQTQTQTINRPKDVQKS